MSPAAPGQEKQGVMGSTPDRVPMRGKSGHREERILLLDLMDGQVRLSLQDLMSAISSPKGHLDHADLYPASRTRSSTYVNGDEGAS